MGSMTLELQIVSEIYSFKLEKGVKKEIRGGSLNGINKLIKVLAFY